MLDEEISKGLKVGVGIGPPIVRGLSGAGDETGAPGVIGIGVGIWSPLNVRGFRVGVGGSPNVGRIGPGGVTVFPPLPEQTCPLGQHPPGIQY